MHEQNNIMRCGNAGLVWFYLGISKKEMEYRTDYMS